MNENEIKDALRLAQETVDGNGLGTDDTLAVARLALFLHEQIQVSRPFKVGDRIRCITSPFKGDEPTCIAVTDKEATFDLQWGTQPLSYWMNPAQWERVPQ